MNQENKEPLFKRVLDNTWLMLALGVLIPLLSYTAWGWIELVLVPPATLP